MLAGRFIVARLPGFTETATLDPFVLIRQQLEVDEGGAGRIGFVVYSLGSVQAARVPLLGHGPATFASKTGLRFNGPEYQRILRAFPAEFSTYPSIALVLVEYGWMGLATLGILLLTILIEARRLATRLHTTVWLAEAAVGGVMLLVLGSLVENLLEVQQVTAAVAVLIAAALRPQLRSATGGADGPRSTSPNDPG